MDVRRGASRASGRAPDRVAPLSPDAGPGVPEALPRTVRELGRRLGHGAIDRLWIFPPLVRGRREWGLVTASCFDRGERRRLVTARYTAERTGRGLFLDTRLVDEGVAPADKLPRVMEGVVRRSVQPLGSPRLVDLDGAAEAFEALMSGFPGDLFEEALAGPRAPG